MYDDRLLFIIIFIINQYLTHCVFIVLFTITLYVYLYTLLLLFTKYYCDVILVILSLRYYRYFVQKGIAITESRQLHSGNDEGAKLVSELTVLDLPTAGRPVAIETDNVNRNIQQVIST